MSKNLRQKFLDVLDPGNKEERGVIVFDRPGSVTINIDRVLQHKQAQHSLSDTQEASSEHEPSVAHSKS